MNKQYMTKAPTIDFSKQTPTPEPNYLLLINPFYPKDRFGSFGKHVLTPSLALTSIAAVTPAKWNVKYWDENLLQGPPPSEPFPAVVGISVHLTFARRAYSLAQWYRQRGAIVILGGMHVTSCPEEALPHADAIAVGEGVGIWPRILNDIDTGNLKKRYDGSYKCKFRNDPKPRRNLIASRDFLTTSSVIATRGCHNRCGFCYLSTKGVHIPYQTREINEVAREIKGNSSPYAVFTDNNLSSNHRYLSSLCKALEKTNKIWSAAVSLDLTDNPTLIRQMSDSGCTGVFIGLETLSGKNLQEAHKKCPLPEEYAQRVEIFHRHGIEVNASFVFGFDHDGPDVFENTISWLESVRLACATFHILTPYPGTPLFAKLDDEGRLLHKNWDLYDTSHAVFKPKHMTARELEEGYRWCYKELFSLRSISKRRPQTVGELPSYLAMVFLYKKANWLWPFLIRHRLTGIVWRPLVEAARLRYLARKHTARHTNANTGTSPARRLLPVYPSV